MTVSTVASNLQCLLEEFRSSLASYLCFGIDDVLKKNIQEWQSNFLCYENEVTHLYLLLMQSINGDQINVPDIDLKNGAWPLFSNENFAWQPLPYPQYHAECTALLFLLAHQLSDAQLLQKADQMIAWQLNTIDSYGLPIAFLWTQEKTCYFDLLMSNAFAFNMASKYSHQNSIKTTYEAVFNNLMEKLGNESQNSNLRKILAASAIKTSSKSLSLSEQICDENYELYGFRNDKYNFFCTSYGCKSGLGAFYSYDVGMCNFGPQLLPLVESQNFGMIHAKKTNRQDNHFHIQTKFVAKNDRETALVDLKDAGPCNLWLESHLKWDDGKLAIAIQTKGLIPLDKVAFVFYVKADLCVIARSHKLRKQTLDRYKGPSLPIEIFGLATQYQLVSQKPTQMEVIPLAGNGNDWGADYLVAYLFNANSLEFNVTIKQ